MQLHRSPLSGHDCEVGPTAPARAWANAFPKRQHPTFASRAMRAGKTWSHAPFGMWSPIRKGTCRVGVNMASPTVATIHVTTDVLGSGLALLGKRPDERYSLTDCVSSVVMREVESPAHSLSTSTSSTRASLRGAPECKTACGCVSSKCLNGPGSATQLPFSHLSDLSQMRALASGQASKPGMSRPDATVPQPSHTGAFHESPSTRPLPPLPSHTGGLQSPRVRPFQPAPRNGRSRRASHRRPSGRANSPGARRASCSRPCTTCGPERRARSSPTVTPRCRTSSSTVVK